MKNKKAIFIMWFLALLPLVMVALCWPHLPEQVPTHWSTSGVVTYSSPAMLWLLAGASPLLALLFQFLPRFDPKRENYEKFQGRYDFFGPLVPLILLLAMAVTLCETFYPGRIDVGTVICLAVGVILAVAGNMMGKIKTNWFMGIRTPWALNDPDVWNKSQRLGGRVFFLSGLALILLTFLASEAVRLWVFFPLLFGGILLTYFMSWKWFQEKKE